MGPSYISRSEAAASQGGQAFARELPKENPPAGKDRALQERGSLTIWGTRAWFSAGPGAHGEPSGQSPRLNGCKQSFDRGKRRRIVWAQVWLTWSTSGDAPGMPRGVNS